MSALTHVFTLAGMEGFEPPNGGTRTRCLTTWRHPNTLLIISKKILPFKSFSKAFLLTKLTISDIIKLFKLLLRTFQED